MGLRHDYLSERLKERLQNHLGGRLHLLDRHHDKFRFVCREVKSEKQYGGRQVEIFMLASSLFRQGYLVISESRVILSGYR
jgi:hypothetical protein